MRNKLIPGLVALAALLVGPAAYAADDDMSGMEMDVMDAHGTPNDASTKTITLPASASDSGRTHSQHGLDTANRAREDAREDKAERDEAPEMGEDTSENARDSHGDAGGDHGAGTTGGDHSDGHH